MAVGDTDDLINYINQEMAKSFERPEDDLGVALPAARERGRYVRGLEVQPIPVSPDPVDTIGKIIYDENNLPSEIHYTNGRFPWKRRHIPLPPYRCICGQTFPTAQELLEHRHPQDNIMVLR